MDQFGFEQLQQLLQANPVVGYAIGGVALLLLIVLIARRRAPREVVHRDADIAIASVDPEPATQPEPEQPVEPGLPRRIARMEEEVRFTGWGAVSLAFLIVCLFADFVNYQFASNLLQQAFIGLQAIGETLLLGGGAALGRRRTYIIYNVPAEPDRS